MQYIAVMLLVFQLLSVVARYKLVQLRGSKLKCHRASVL